MIRILLIDPPWYALQNITYNYCNYGIASLGAVLQQSGFDCLLFDGEQGLLSDKPFNEHVLIDYNVYQTNLIDTSDIWQKTWSRLEAIIHNYQPQIVGISIPTAKYGIACKLIRRIKTSYPSIFIIAGGPHPTIMPEETISIEGIDAVVRGEGEQTMLELVKAFQDNRDLSSIDGLTLKKDNNIIHTSPRPFLENLDQLPFPAWDRFYQWETISPVAFGTLFSSRGCPYHCSFCASHKIWSRKVRYLSVDRVLNELEYVSTRFGTRSFRFTDDTFILNPRRVEAICQEILKRNLNIRWSCEVRADLCESNLLNLMKTAGCYHVNIGIESGNPKILKSINKGIDLADIRRAIKIIKRTGLEVMGYFMFGFPNETPEEIQDSIDLMNELNLDVPCWSIVTPYPGTPLYEEVIEQGLLPNHIDWSVFFHHSPLMHISKTMSLDELTSLGCHIQNQIEYLRSRKNHRQRIFWALHHPGKFLTKYTRKMIHKKENHTRI